MAHPNAGSAGRRPGSGQVDDDTFTIDPPERNQTCDDGHWPPGPLARQALEGFIAGRPVTCKQVDTEARRSPPVAQCFVGEDDRR